MNEWFFIRRENVIIYGPMKDGLNYAAYHCGGALIDWLTVRNIGEKKSIGMHLEMQLVDYSDICHVYIPELATGASINFDAPFFHLHSEAFRRSMETTKTSLHVVINGAHIPEAEKDVKIYGFWDWSYSKEDRKTIAAFVSPYHPFVENIIRDAQIYLKRLTGTDDFEQFLKKDRNDAELLVLKSIYQCLSQGRSINYISPKKKTGSRDDKFFQTLRPPDRIFSKNDPFKGKATCLDLTALTAACVENVGLCPLIIFLGRNEEDLYHCFIGIWASSIPGARHLINDKELLKNYIDSGQLIAAEITGASEGAYPDSVKLTFEQAVRKARAHLDRSPWSGAVDISALRPPNGEITPLDSPWQPEIAQAYNMARQFAALENSRAVETTHLFFGLIASRGKVVQWMFREADLDISSILNSWHRTHKGIDRALKYPDFYTRNFFEIKTLAREYAAKSFSPSVHEQDLMWAILDKGSSSKKLKKICYNYGIDLDKLSKILELRYPRFSPYFETETMPEID